MADDQKALKKRLKVLMNRPENQVCTDCPERQPRWASLIVPPPGAPPGSGAIGAFCCLECSGSHRRLGVHISFVRSINLDSWKEKEVQAMENGGNAKVNAIFEAHLARSGVQKPSNHADGPTRERFIRDKYERRKFYDASVFQNLPVPAPDVQQQSQNDFGPPSEAAKQRMEARRLKKANSALTGSRKTGSEAGTSPRSITPPNRTPPRSRTPPRIRAPIRTKSMPNSGGKTSAPEPVEDTDFLDLSSPPSAAPFPQSAPQHDLFEFLVQDNKELKLQTEEKSSSLYSQDIMNLYNNNNQPMMNQQQFGNFNAFNVPHSQSMPGLTNRMGQMSLQQPGSMNPQAMNPQMMMMMQQQQMMMMQQQQHQQMMMQQQQQGGMSNMMMQQQPIGMMMGSNMPQNNNFMMMNPNGAFVGAPQQAMSTGSDARPSLSHFQPQETKKKTAPEKEDPFAQFGMNVFRS